MTAKIVRCLFLVGWLLLSNIVLVAAQGQPCAGFGSQLKVGAQARVTPGSANNLRQNAGVSQTKIGQIPGGQIVMVLGGPTCADNVTWWQVNYNGQVGWTGEGQGSQHWMDTNVTAASQPHTPLNGLQGTSASTLFVNKVCFLLDGQPMGRAIINNDVQGVDNGAPVPFSISNLSLDNAPDLCVPGYLVGTARAVSPFGEVIQPRTLDYGNGEVYQVSLPLWAYSVPGLWQLSVDGFSITIDVQRAAQPVLQRFGGDILLGGFQPGERVVVVYGEEKGRGSAQVAPEISTELEFAGGVQLNPIQPLLMEPDRAAEIEVYSGLNVRSTLEQVQLYELSNPDLMLAQMGDNSAPNPFSVQIDQLTGTEVVIDANGYFVGSLPLNRNQRLVAAVSASGAVVISPGLVDLSLAGGSEDTAKRALYDAFFGSSVTSAGAWVGPREVGTDWQYFLDVFAGDDGVIYGIQADGTLLWYMHYGYTDGTFNWGGPAVVGSGWNVPITGFTSDNGVLYAVSPDGDLWWYRHDGRYEGSESWAGVYPVSFGGWNQFRSVFAGDGGAIYAVTQEGNLWWYKHQDYLGGTSDFAGPVEVGSGGWGAFKKVFAGEGGVIYGLYPDGRLFRYLHYGYQDGTANWAERQEIGGGWQDFVNVFAGEGNVIYAIRQDGVLLWYRYDG